MRARGLARDAARRQYAVAARGSWQSPYGPVPAPSAQAKAAAKTHGQAAAQAVAEYESFATSLASLRLQARRGTAGPDFAARELELLHHLWQRREVAAPALTYAAQATGRLRPSYPPPPYPQPFPPYAQHPQHGHPTQYARYDDHGPGQGPGPVDNPYLVPQQPPQ